MAAFVSETTFTSGTTAVTSQTVAGPAGATNLAVLRIHRTTASAVTGVTDTAGNTWRFAARGAASGSAGTRLELWYAEGYIPATTVTIALPSQQVAGSIVGFSGMAASGALDVASPVDSGSAGSTSTTITTPSITTTVAGDLVIGAAGHGRTITAGAVGSPWTQTAGAPPLNGTLGTSEFAYQLGVAVGSYAATFTESSTMIASVFTVAFKSATGSARTGTIALSGSGTLGFVGSPRTSGTLALSATGRLTAGVPPENESGYINLGASAQLAISGAGTWPHLGLTATPDATTTPPSIRIDIADTRPSPALSLTLYRTGPDGHTYPVRTADGGQVLLSGGMASVVDYEAPFDSPITYSTSVAGGDVIVTELDVPDPWLIHLGVPSRSVRLNLRKGSNAQEGWTVDQGSFKILGRDTPIINTGGARTAGASTLFVETTTEADRVALKLLLSDSSTLLLGVPLALGLGIDSGYIAIGDVQVTRQSDDGTYPGRDVTLPYQITSRPAGGTQAAITWNTIASQYPTWQSIVDAGVQSWADLSSPTA